MPEAYLLKAEKGKLYYDSARMLKESEISVITNAIRLKILKLLAKKPMYAIELAKKLGIHEQKVYYHLNKLIKAGFVEVSEKKQIRGAVAKRYIPKALNFTLSLSNRFSSYSKGSFFGSKQMLDFIGPVLSNTTFNCSIIVGSPDPHGPFKARARDGHYATELAFCLGGYARSPESFIVKLDVDTDLRKEKGNYIIVGGPVTNLAMNLINPYLPASFSEKKPWGITGKEQYYEESTGLVARIKSPFYESNFIYVFAGISAIGTKAAVLALTKFSNILLSGMKPESFYAIVQGYDLNADGKIDSIEVLEHS